MTRPGKYQPSTPGKGEPPTSGGQNAGGSNGCLMDTRNPNRRRSACPPPCSRRTGPVHSPGEQARSGRYFTYSAEFTHFLVSRCAWSQCSRQVGYCTYRAHMCNTGHFGQVPFRSVEARCTTRACRTGFPRAGGPVRLRATRLSLGSRTTTRGSLRSPTQRSPSVTSSNVEWTGRSFASATLSTFQ